MLISAFGKRILREHIATKHEVKNLYKCKECNSEFKHSGDLGIHKRRVRSLLPLQSSVITPRRETRNSISRPNYHIFALIFCTSRLQVHKAQWSKFGRSDMKRCPDCPYETKRKYEFVFHRLEQHENFPIVKEDPMIKCGVEECAFQADDELKFVNHVQAKHNPDGVST